MQLQLYGTGDDSDNFGVNCDLSMDVFGTQLYEYTSIQRLQWLNEIRAVFLINLSC